MPLSVVAIKPRRKPVGTASIEDLIADHIGSNGFAGDMVREMADYPTQQQTVSGYRRTGALGRGWRIENPRRSANFISIEVVNRVRYTVHVQGPKRGVRGQRQTAEMRRRNWKNVTDASQRVWNRRRPALVRIITQRDARARERF
jgi:hypothetical protein